MTQALSYPQVKAKYMSHLYAGMLISLVSFIIVTDKQHFLFTS